VAFLGPGCGASGDSAIPLQEASKDDAILVGLNGIDNCFTHDVADTPELPYFDETVKNVEAELCVDPSHLFVAGFSSGSWLATTLGCARADVLKAQASVAGGLPPMPACKGPIPAMYVSDTDDSKNPPATVKEALDRVLAVDGCSAETEPYDIGVPSPCVRYKGCLPGFPVVSCVTSGLGHADQSSTHVSTTGFWHFWTSLP
jgi:poly(3-hydroxybutyrate) depolymerase